MANNLAKEEEGGSQKKKKNLEGWKYPRIPIDHVYKKKLLGMFTSYAVKDHEKTIPVKAANQNISAKLFSKDFLYGFAKKKHNFVHLGLVQISIKPLSRDGIGGPIVVSLRDTRQNNFENSLLALMEADLSQGPFYFNCFPNFSVSLDDDSSFNVLNLYVKTEGTPLALTYRIVCKAMVDLSSRALKEPVLGETAYFQPATGAICKTRWNEVQIPESWTKKPEPQPRATFSSLSNGNFTVRFPSYAREV